MSSFITLAQAMKMTTKYRDQRRGIVETSLDESVLPLCETFDRDQIDIILAKTGCIGLRFYFGIDDDENVKLVMVGVNESDGDIYLGSDSIADRAARCPTSCPPSSPLNTGIL